jgi:hypothetical protein
MKNNQIMSFVAAAAVSIPALAVAQGVFEPRFGGEVPSTLDFRLTITTEGPFRGEQESNVSNRFSTARVGVREFLEFVADMNEIDLPRGARLMLVEGSVWIFDRRDRDLEDPILNVSDYFSFGEAGDPVVVGSARRSGNSNSTTETVNTQTKYLAEVAVDLRDSKVVMAEGEGGTVLEAIGLASNRYSNRETESNTRFTSNTSSSTSARVQGAGTFEGDDAVVEGTVRVNGRESFREDFSSRN